MRVSRRSSPKSNKGREASAGKPTWRLRRRPEVAAPPLWQKYSEPFAHVDWNFAACSRKKAAAHRAQPDPRDRLSTADKFSHPVKYLGPSPSSFRRSKHAGD